MPAQWLSPCLSQKHLWNFQKHRFLNPTPRMIQWAQDAAQTAMYIPPKLLVLRTTLPGTHLGIFMQPKYSNMVPSKDTLSMKNLFDTLSAPSPSPWPQDSKETQSSFHTQFRLDTPKPGKGDSD